jgi:hypothetical protein
MRCGKPEPKPDGEHGAKLACLSGWKITKRFSGWLNC